MSIEVLSVLLSVRMDLYKVFTEHILCTHTESAIIFKIEFCVYSLCLSRVLHTLKLSIKPAFFVFGSLLLPHAILYMLSEREG